MSYRLDSPAGATSMAVAAPTPFFHEDFSEYGTTAQLRASAKYFSDTVWDNPGQGGGATLDTSDGYNGSPNSMLVSFADQTGNLGSRCGDYNPSQVNAVFADSLEIWQEVVYKFDPTFTTRAPSGWGCGSNPDYKLNLTRVRVVGRFQAFVGTGGAAYTFGYPGHEDDFEGGNSTPLFDGAWHVMRQHLRVGVGGTARLLVDGVVKKDYGIVNMAANAMWGLALGRNMNQGPGLAFGYRVGLVNVYNVDPGPGW